MTTKTMTMKTMTEGTTIAACILLLIILGIAPACADSSYAPAIAKINPQIGYNTAPLNITNLGGTSFVDGAAVSLMPPNYPVALSHAGLLADGDGGALLDGAHSVFVKGTTAYVASKNNDALEIIDVADPANPAHLANLVHGTGGALLDEAWSVYVQGDYAYVASRNSNALEIVDISTPSSPTHVKSIVNNSGSSYLGKPSGVYVTNGSTDGRARAYVISEGTNALQIIDVSDPSNPIIQGYISNASGAVGNMSTPRGIFVSGKYAYIASELSDGLEIVDITNMWTPVHAGFIGNGDGGARLNNPYSVQVVGNYAYVASYMSNALEIVNVSNPKSPKHEGYIVNGSGGALLYHPMSVAVNGIYAYVATQDGNSTAVIDISNPKVPVHKASLANGAGGASLWGPNGIFVSGDYAYVANNWGKSLEVIDTDTGTIKATGENVASATRITCWFPLTGQPAGKYHVVVKNPDLQQAVWQNGFTIAVPPGALSEPYPGWKYRGVLNNTGIYNDGGYRPNGLELWNFTDVTQTVDVGIMESTPAIAGGIVYVGDRNKNLYAIFANNGSLKWKTTLSKDVYGSPAVANGKVYVGSGSGANVPDSFYAIDAATGVISWQKNYTSGVDSSPVVWNGTVIVGRVDRNVSAYNAITGEEVWRFQTADDVRTGMAISNGRVFFAADDGNIFALDAPTGDKVWDSRNSTSFTSFVPESSPAVAYGKVYIGGSGGVFAFDEYNGDMLFKFTRVSTHFYSSPAAANGLIYTGSIRTSGSTPNAIYALNATDLTVKWQWNVTDDNGMYSSPAVANGVVYITSDRANNASEGYLYALRATTGVPVWGFHTPGLGGTYSSPAVANGVVYFGTGYGLYAVGTENMITVTIPNGGNTWKQGTTQTIRWNYMGSPGPMVKIDLLKGAVVNKVINASTSVGSAGSGSYSWKVPFNQVIGTDYKIRITSTSNAAHTDKSNANFTISAGVPITVTTPNGGNIWKQGTTQIIRWSYTGNPGSSVKIDLLKGAVVNKVINASTSMGSGGAGSYSWKIPASQVVGTDYKIRITSTSNATYTDKSNANFTISAL